MHVEITRQVRDTVAVAAKTEVPAQVRAVGQESVAKARGACAKLNAVAEKGAKALEDVILIAQSSAKTGCAQDCR